MSRTTLAAILLILAGGVLALGFYSAWLEREYRHLIGQGQAALAQDQTFVAIESFSGAIALKPDSMLAHLRRGETYRRRGDLSSAYRDLKKAVQLDPTATQPLEQLGDVAYARLWYDRAGEAYSSYIRLDDRSPHVHYKLALARLKSGQPDAATPLLQQALQLDERFAEAHYLLGLSLRASQKPAEAVRALQAALRLSPGLLAAREELADLYADLQRRRDEIDQLDALRGLEPGRAERHVALGMAYANSGRSDLAIVTLGAAAERFPQQPLVYAALGEVWLRSAENRSDEAALRKALEALDVAARQPLADSRSLTLLGRALLLDGQVGEAERILRRATENEPVEPIAYALLARAAERLKHHASARESLLKYACLTGDPMGRSVAARLGDLSMSLQEPLVAAAWFERAASADSTPTGDLLLRLAEAYMTGEDEQRARETVQQVLAVDPDNAAARRLASRLN